MSERTYTEEVYSVAMMYNDVAFTYDAALSACRDIARDFKRQSESVYEDFEIACDVLKENK